MKLFELQTSPAVTDSADQQEHELALESTERSEPSCICSLSSLAALRLPAFSCALSTHSRHAHSV